MKIKLCSLIISLLFISLAFNAIAQDQFNCEELLAEEMVLTEMRDNAGENLLNLLECGLDSIDLMMLSHEHVLGSILIELSLDKEDQVLTYGDLVNKISEHKEHPQYARMREIYIAGIELSRRDADIKQWEEDRALLETIGVPDTLIEEFYIYFTEHSDSSKRFDEVFQEFMSKYEPEPEITYEEEVQLLIQHSKNFNYDTMLQMSGSMHKPVLVYFTGYSAVNCLKMQSDIFTHSEVFRYLSDSFIFLPLFVDDKTELPESDWIKDKYGRPVKTIGKKNILLQQEKFQSASQPSFYILDSNERVLLSTGYHKNKSPFLDFLKAGMKEYNRLR